MTGREHGRQFRARWPSSPAPSRTTGLGAARAMGTAAPQRRRRRGRPAQAPGPPGGQWRRHCRGSLLRRLIARILASRRPLAGLVLIDAAQEDTTRLTARLHAKLELPPRRLDEPEWLTLARFERAMHLDAAFPRNLPNSEGMGYEATRQQAIEAGHLGNTPLVVIAAGKRQQLRRYGAEGVVAELDQEWERVWKECQRKLMDLSSDATFIEATESDHYVQRDQPELVVQAVRKLIERVRQSGGIGS
jgi:pimeloyl-ACP methyl ester carboxylesterase